MVPTSRGNDTGGVPDNIKLNGYFNQYLAQNILLEMLTVPYDLSYGQTYERRKKIDPLLQSGDSLPPPKLTEIELLHNCISVYQDFLMFSEQKCSRNWIRQVKVVALVVPIIYVQSRSSLILDRWTISLSRVRDLTNHYDCNIRGFRMLEQHL